MTTDLTQSKGDQTYYLTFTKDHDRIDAVKIFTHKLGFQPDEVFIKYQVLWLGPVTKELSHA